MTTNKPRNTATQNKLRRIVLREQGTDCIRCGSPFDIEVAHIWAAKDGGIDESHNAAPLCSDCHAEHHRYWYKKDNRINLTEEEAYVIWRVFITEQPSKLAVEKRLFEIGVPFHESIVSRFNRLKAKCSDYETRARLHLAHGESLSEESRLLLAEFDEIRQDAPVPIVVGEAGCLTIHSKP